MDTYRYPDTGRNRDDVSYRHSSKRPSGRGGHYCRADAFINGFAERRLRRRRYKADGSLRMTVYSTAVGIILSGIYVSILLVNGKIGRKDQFALGPFLVMGIIGMKLWTYGSWYGSILYEKIHF